MEECKENERKDLVNQSQAEKHRCYQKVVIQRELLINSQSPPIINYQSHSSICSGFFNLQNKLYVYLWI